MPDEITTSETNQNLETVSAEQPKPDTSDSNSGVKIGGRVYTEKEIKELEESRVNFQRDYTKKTTDLAQQRKEVDNLRDTVLTERERVGEVLGAFKEDLEFYNTHEKDLWDNYSPRSLSMAQELGITPKSSPEVKMLMDKLGEMSARIDSLSKVRMESSVEDQVDEVLGTATKLISKDYPLADDEEVLSGIRLYHVDNDGKLPSKEEILKMVRKSHDKAVSKGIQMPRAAVGKSAGDAVLKSSGKPPAALNEPVPNLFDRTAIRKASQQWLDARRSS